MSAPTPQRYDCAGPKNQWDHCEGCYHMEPHPRGDYVHWDDYDDLRALNAELASERQQLRIALQLIEAMRCLHGKPERCPCPCCIAGRALRLSAKGETP